MIIQSSINPIAATHATKVSLQTLADAGKVPSTIDDDVHARRDCTAMQPPSIDSVDPPAAITGHTLTQHPDGSIFCSWWSILVADNAVTLSVNTGNDTEPPPLESTHPQVLAFISAMLARLLHAST